MKTIYMVLAGSRGYGTHTPTSDYDWRGVMVPDKGHMIGLKPAFEQFQQGELTIFSLQKFARLAVECNPNIIELLWAKTCEEHPAFWPFIDERDRLLSQKAQYTFNGYAKSQLKRIETHRKWLLNPPDHKPERSEFGLPEESKVPAEIMALVQSKVDSWALDLAEIDGASRKAILTQLEEQFTYDVDTRAVKALGFSEESQAQILGEKRYLAALKHWKQYNTWKTERNPARAALEAKCGYDAKHAMHLIRLLRMGSEILEGQGVQMWRSDREELLFIREGHLTYDALMDMVSKEDERLLEAVKTTKLPKKPDLTTLGQTVEGIHERAWHPALASLNVSEFIRKNTEQ